MEFSQRIRIFWRVLVVRMGHETFGKLFNWRFAFNVRHDDLDDKLVPSHHNATPIDRLKSSCSKLFSMSLPSLSFQSNKRRNNVQWEPLSTSDSMSHQGIFFLSAQLDDPTWIFLRNYQTGRRLSHRSLNNVSTTARRQSLHK